MDFGNAIRELKDGKSLYRKGWNGKGICIRLMKAGDSLDMTQDYIYIDTTNLKTENRDAPKSKVPWLASQTDMLANDWEVVEGLTITMSEMLKSLKSLTVSFEKHSATFLMKSR